MRRRAGIGDLAGRRALITGAASGIGRATAEAAAARGAELYLTDLQPAGLEAAVAATRIARFSIGDAFLYSGGDSMIAPTLRTAARKPAVPAACPRIRADPAVGR